jgi:hypothetical protein
MKIRLTPNQQMWANIFQCAVKRSDIYFKKNDLDRYTREHTTVALALQKGDHFWKKLL